MEAAAAQEAPAKSGERQVIVSGASSDGASVAMAMAARAKSGSVNFILIWVLKLLGIVGYGVSE